MMQCGTCWGLPIRSIRTSMKLSESFRKASELAPDVALYWTNLSSLFRDKGRLSENSHLTTLARECSHKAIDLQPQNARLYVDVALTYLDESDFSAARQWLDRGLSCEAKTAMDELEALLVLAELHVKAKDYEKVKDVAEQVKNIPEATIPVIAYASKKTYIFGIRDVQSQLTTSVHWPWLRPHSFFTIRKSALD